MSCDRCNAAHGKNKRCLCTCHPREVRTVPHDGYVTCTVTDGPSNPKPADPFASLSREDRELLRGAIRHSLFERKCNDTERDSEQPTKAELSEHPSVSRRDAGAKAMKPTNEWLNDVRLVCANELSPEATYLAAEETVRIIDAYFEQQSTIERLRGALERIAQSDWDTVRRLARDALAVPGRGNVCSTCGEARDGGMLCSNGFHMCQRCIWQDGKIIEACEEHQ